MYEAVQQQSCMQILHRKSRTDTIICADLLFFRVSLACIRARTQFEMFFIIFHYAHTLSLCPTETKPK